MLYVLRTRSHCKAGHWEGRKEEKKSKRQKTSVVVVAAKVPTGVGDDAKKPRRMETD